MCDCREIGTDFSEPTTNTHKGNTTMTDSYEWIDANNVVRFTRAPKTEWEIVPLTFDPFKDQVREESDWTDGLEMLICSPLLSRHLMRSALNYEGDHGFGPAEKMSVLGWMSQNMMDRSESRNASRFNIIDEEFSTLVEFKVFAACLYALGQDEPEGGDFTADGLNLQTHAYPFDIPTVKEVIYWKEVWSK